MRLQLKKFDPRSMGGAKIVVLLGKRNTGKSCMVLDLLYHKRHMHAMGICMSATEEGNKFYSQYIPDSFIYNDFDKAALERLVARQRRLCKQGTPSSVFLVLDDCCYDKRLLRDKVMRSIFMNGRHWHIDLILTSQYLMDLPPDLRTNIDYVITLRENVRSNREKLYKNFFGVFPDYQTFSCVMDQTTENYECLVLDNTSRSNKIEEIVYWYKANIHKPFRMCSPQCWEYHEKNYNPKHDDDDISQDTHAKQARAQSVIVRKKRV